MLNSDLYGLCRKSLFAKKTCKSNNASPQSTLRWFPTVNISLADKTLKAFNLSKIIALE